MFERSPYHDSWAPPVTADAVALYEQLAGCARLENQAAARRLRAICAIFELRRRQRGEREDWAVDTWAAVGAELAAALRISVAKAGSLMTYGLAMLRLPKVATVFESGEIDMDVFKTIVYRTALIEDEEVMAALDAELAGRVARWPSMTRGRLANEIDRVIARHDRDALRQARERASDRGVWFSDQGDGTVEVDALLTSTDSAALQKRLDALAATVCGEDPRTKDQRHADALGALAVGLDRLACRCESAQCPAGERPASNGVVIHVVAEEAAAAGRSTTPGYVQESASLIPAELVVELAKDARLRPLMPPADPWPEGGYRPSAALDAFVRSRDLTCRAPGCDRPAVFCDVDHTIPWPAGPTHAGNLGCLCRLHHLLKTFWGWRVEQLPDATMIWTVPGGRKYVTTPGSALLFPTLSAPTPPRHRAGHLSPTESDGGDRSARMPRRKTTRTQNRAKAITAERRRNRAERRHCDAAVLTTPPADNDADPPPF